MAPPLSPGSIQSKYYWCVVYCSLVVFITLMLVHLQASPATRGAGVDSFVQEDQQPRRLEPAIPIEREIAGGQSHFYQIALADGQYANLVVDQRGIDVVLNLFGPDGKQIMEVDSEIRTRGQESVSLVAEAAGDYRLSVQPKLNRAAAGTYEIRIGEVRAATENDRTLQEARKIYTESIRLRRAGKYSEAQPLGERALEIRVKYLGPEHPDVAQSLNNLAVIYSIRGEYAKAEPLHHRSLAVWEKALGPEHPSVAGSLNNLALLYMETGDYAKVEPLYQRALTISEKALGPEHPDVARTLHNLALLYSDRADYTKAEFFYQRTLTIWEKTLGSEHPNIALALNNLAGDYYERGDYAKAELLYQRALTIREKTLEPEHPIIASSVMGLALVCNARDEYAKAESLYQRALDIREKSVGPEHRVVALALNNFARFYHKWGKYAKAESLFLRGLDIREKSLGPEHRDVGLSLDRLALLYLDMGDYAKAEPLFLRGLAIREKSLGPEHPDVADSLNNLAVLYVGKGEIAQATTYQARANAVRERNFELNLAIGSERQKLAYLALFSKETDLTLSLHSELAPNDPRALNIAFTTLLRRKGRGLDAMTDTIASLRRHATPQEQKLFDQMVEARSQFAMLTLRGSSTANPDAYRTKLKTLEEKVEELESTLITHSAKFRSQRQPVTLSTVQAVLSAGSVLIEFATYRPRHLQTGKSKPPRYLAYLLAAQGPPRWVDLGEAAPIDRVVADWRKTLRDPNRADVKQLARTVDEKVMQPVRSLLGEMPGETRMLLIAPDGALNLIPFAALMDEQNRYLVERYAISYLTSGRDLLQAPEPRQNRSTALVVANPAFGKSASVAVQADQTSENSKAGDQGRVRTDFTRISFHPLPGTEAEAVAIKAVVPEAKMLLWEQATEAAIKQVKAPRILHIATHGFFLSNQVVPPAESSGLSGDDPLRMSDLRLSKWAAHIKDPLLRSGLALAGANQSKSEEDDGLLTALEVAGLDLLGTDLVVLSACDTGIGEVENGDGVHGLRRALVLAGSKTQVMSLWPVSDKVTRELMVAYYRGLKQGQGRGEALRRVQLSMLKNGKRQHPFYWAAFIQSGEWANLEGRR